MYFEIGVKDNKARQITAVRLMSAQVLTGIGAMLFLLQPREHIWSTILLISGIFLLIFTLRNKQAKKKATYELPIRIAEIILSVAFTIYAASRGFLIPSVIVTLSFCSLVFALIIERNRQKFSTVKVDSIGIKRPLVLKNSKVNWPEVEQIMLRFGTLTINCDGNRFYQYSIENYNFDASEFETFCTNKIQEGKTRRKNNSNDW